MSFFVIGVASLEQMNSSTLINRSVLLLAFVLGWMLGGIVPLVPNSLLTPDWSKVMSIKWSIPSVSWKTERRGYRVNVAFAVSVALTAVGWHFQEVGMSLAPLNGLFILSWVPFLLGLFGSYFRDFCFILLYSLLKMVFIMQVIYVYCGKFRTWIGKKTYTQN